ncbi:hypothetical protein HMF8227_01699 [Saliniradius amylolyticus]|uniref:DUF2061 domain-containing protein n=1 Tax=Saliniradius amylolyticus TaxID=2183582 RepID=A0A2S2E3S7_9ALTE|nr:DUF2061 domain-containing protein [Saliniradius amylolyticus]AWL12172.1 hypothetical protein HMF8227_01699 [Saliniradius amylolyticus]
MFKTISFALVHFSVAFTITYLLTGSVMAGGLVALIEPTVNTFAFYLHEKCWQHFSHRSVRSSLVTQPSP